MNNKDIFAKLWNIEKKEFEELGWRPNFKAINNHYILKH